MRIVNPRAACASASVALRRAARRADDEAQYDEAGRSIRDKLISLRRAIQVIQCAAILLARVGNVIASAAVVLPV
jgi:hypothetical protein